MLGLPPLPPFEGLHPIVVHFPIGILLIAWLPMLIGLIDAKRRNAWLASAAMLLIVGTVACFGATLTGDAAEDVVGATSAVVDAALEQHEETAEWARNLFVAVTVIYLAAWLAGNKVAEKKRAMVAISAGVFVAVAYGVAALAIMNAGHQGGVLVHQHGIHAPITAPATVGGVVEGAYRELDDHDDDD